jgi:hypothetical protein
MWIRDELPKAVPGVRAIIYGYDSPLIGSTSFQSISDIALGFVHQLGSGGWNLASSKPIVFLAHSLGGLVLKEALIQIADRNASNILSTLRGAIMFGVPSLGMQQSHLLAMVKGQANDILVQDLSRENGVNYLRQLNKSFDGISFTRTARIFWAYETKESHTVVVSYVKLCVKEPCLARSLLTLCRNLMMAHGPKKALEQSLSTLIQPLAIGITIARTNFSQFP